MVYRGTSLWLWVAQGLVSIMAVAAMVWLAVELLHMLPFLGGLLLYVTWLDRGTSGAARWLGGRPPESLAGRGRDRHGRESR